MKSNVIDFSQKRRAHANTKEKAQNPAPEPSGNTLKLWHFSLSIDKLITDAVAYEKLPPDEVAAMLAHRLGALIKASENSHELLPFCLQVIEKLNQDKKRN